VNLRRGVAKPQVRNIPRDDESFVVRQDGRGSFQSVPESLVALRYGSRRERGFQVPVVDGIFGEDVIPSPLLPRAQQCRCFVRSNVAQDLLVEDEDERNDRTEPEECYGDEKAADEFVQTVVLPPTPSPSNSRHVRRGIEIQYRDGIPAVHRIRRFFDGRCAIDQSGPLEASFP